MSASNQGLEAFPRFEDSQTELVTEVKMGEIVIQPAPAKGGEAEGFLAYKARIKARKQASGGAIADACRWIVDNQLAISLTFLGTLFCARKLLPDLEPQLSRFYNLSYFNEATGLYGKGVDDLYVVLLWIMIFTGLRVFAMNYIFMPFASSRGILSKKGRVRFAEQAWLFVYDSTTFTVGFSIFYYSTYWMNFKAIWTDWPTREIDGIVKQYYLVQYAFWLQQIIVVHIEERRKDHHQMFAHHIITCSLLYLSYAYHTTKAGVVILVMMDFVDILLPFAKMLKYMHFLTLCDVAFGVFLLAWFVLRHVVYNRLLWSAWYDTPTNMLHGCYMPGSSEVTYWDEKSDQLLNLARPLWDPNGKLCWNMTMRRVFMGLLISLQVLTIMWFVLIMRIAIRVVSGKGADDSRSDDELEEEIEEAKLAAVEAEMEAASLAAAAAEAQALAVEYEEEEVGVEDMDVSLRIRGTGSGKSANGRKKRKNGAEGTSSGGERSSASASSSAVKKELLGRIGCDKG